MSKAETRLGWEEAEFPILCETCLGETPYVRMTRQSFGKECKICNRPFTVFRWLPGRGMRYKKTEICQTCAKVKNVCQTCVLDLQWALPVHTRDMALNPRNQAPKSSVNREFYAQNIEREIAETQALPESGRLDPAGRELLRRMARSEPYYERNRSHICSFFLKGTCSRGNTCPYRHERPNDDPQLAKQNIKDRYHGTNDPVAQRLLDRAQGTMAQLKPPTDKSITSLFVTELTDEITEDDLREYFGAYGEIKSVVVVRRSNCAFVNFVTRAGAEIAADKTMGSLVIKDKSLRVAWGRPRPRGPKSDSKAQADDAPKGSQVPLPPGAEGAKTHYPSQNPTLQGSRT